MVFNHSSASLKSGGQYAPKQGGQFGAKQGGHFKMKRGGQLVRNIHSTAKLRFLDGNEEVSLYRDKQIALSEYAPNNTIYYNGQKFQVDAISKEADINQLQKFLVCTYCNYVEALRTNQTKPTNCSCCGNTLENVHDLGALLLPSMRARRRMKITSEEEERTRSGFQLIHSYESSPNAMIKLLMRDTLNFGRISFQRSANLFHLNLGSVSEIRRTGSGGFMMDVTTGKWVTDASLQNQQGNANVAQPNIQRGINL